MNRYLNYNPEVYKYSLVFINSPTSFIGTDKEIKQNVLVFVSLSYITEEFNRDEMDDDR